MGYKGKTGRAASKARRADSKKKSSSSSSKSSSSSGSSSGGSSSSSSSRSSSNPDKYKYEYGGRSYENKADATAASRADGGKSSSRTSSTPSRIKRNTPLPALSDTVARAIGLLGDAYKPGSGAPTAERLDEISNQSFIKPEVKAAYDSTKLQPINQNYLAASYNATLPKTTVPSTAEGVVSPYQPFESPTPTLPTGDISSAISGSDGLQAFSQYSSDFYQQQLDRQEAQSNQQATGFQSLLNSLKSPEEARSEAQAETGINVSDHFAQQEAGFAEIEGLTNEYNATMEAKDQQIAQTHDKLASNNFINNQIQQIERNAAPKLNRLSADINAKAAVMQAQQGNFAEAQKYVNQAVSDATAQNKFNSDMFEMAYKINQDAFEKVESIYSSAYTDTMAIAKLEYEQQLADKTAVGKLLLEYPNAGIDIYNDSIEEAIRKAGPSAAAAQLGKGPGLTADMRNYNAAVESGYEGNFADFLGKGGGSSDRVGGLATALFLGQIGIGDVPSADRNEVLNLYNEMKSLSEKEVSSVSSTDSGPGLLANLTSYAQTGRPSGGGTGPVYSPAGGASTPAYSGYTAPTSTPPPAVQFGLPQAEDAFYQSLFED